MHNPVKEGVHSCPVISAFRHTGSTAATAPDQRHCRSMPGQATHGWSLVLYQAGATTPYIRVSLFTDWPRCRGREKVSSPLQITPRVFVLWMREHKSIKPTGVAFCCFSAKRCKNEPSLAIVHVDLHQKSLQGLCLVPRPQGALRRHHPGPSLHALSPG